MALKDPSQLNRPAHPSAAGDRPKPQHPSDADPAASGHRVEAVNALALNNQHLVKELQDVVAMAAQAQQAAAKQTAQAIKALTSGEYLYGEIQRELAAIAPPVAPLNVQFETVTVKQLLPSSDEVLHSLGLLPAA
jgi:hypothetical protein